MIPKVIHYCWFGRGRLPKSAVKYIESWKKFFPDYEIKEWNEDNFDVNRIPYSQTAYSMKKYAFVSDYARYWILYHCGGVYFDTDVEVIKSFDDILSAGPFLGIEKSRAKISINPGLGMGAVAKMPFYREVLEDFERWQFNQEPIAPILIKSTTERMINHGFIYGDKKQTIAGITIYPNDVFNPYDDYTGRLNITLNTHSIHYFAKSWIDHYSPLHNWLSKRYHRITTLLEKFM